MLNYLLSRYLHVDAQNGRYRYLQVLLSMILSVITVSVFFIGYNLFVQFYFPFVVIHSSVALISLLSLYLLLHKKQVRLAALLQMSLGVAECFLVMLDAGNQEYTLAFLIVIPVGAVFLLGYVIGGLFSLGFFIAFSWLCYDNWNDWQPSPFDLASYVNLSAAFVIVFIVACLYESTRVAAHRQLIEANRKLAAQVYTDVLTGLYNRRYFEDLLMETDKPLLMALVDVDDFKQINDNFGHDMGDEVLREVAKIMKDTMGEAGVVARWGGEEFVLLYHDNNLHNFINKLEDIRDAIAQHVFPMQRLVTISLGGSVHEPADHRSSLRRIDSALYEAKASGKNCLILDI